mmetsp:Transcript_80951/g.203694  ORF Transcript_80951/g.203694 Transcript_80951/m.203694 type:complete len:297 (+) Transcript_80951:540-1430(+)
MQRIDPRDLLRWHAALLRRIAGPLESRHVARGCGTREGVEELGVLVSLPVLCLQQPIEAALRDRGLFRETLRHASVEDLTELRGITLGLIDGGAQLAPPLLVLPEPRKRSLGGCNLAAVDTRLPGLSNGLLKPLHVLSCRGLHQLVLGRSSCLPFPLDFLRVKAPQELPMLGVSGEHPARTLSKAHPTVVGLSLRQNDLALLLDAQSWSPLRRLVADDHLRAKDDLKLLRPPSWCDLRCCQHLRFRPNGTQELANAVARTELLQDPPRLPIEFDPTFECLLYCRNMRAPRTLVNGA